MSPTHSGLTALVGACMIWGLSPIYYKALSHVPAPELLAHRTFWSFAIFSGILAIRGRLAQVGQALRSPELGRIMLAALMISCNWFLFIYSVQIERTTQTSLGYYMFPLVSVLLGVVLLGERLSRLQAVSVALAASAVVVLSLGLDSLPWISVVLATTFGLYGLLKKRLSIASMVSVTAEVVVLAPIALGYIAWVHLGTVGGAFGSTAATTLLLVASGFITAMPLVLFSYATQRVTLSTVGLVQYLNPTLQFFCAVVLFREPFGWVQATAFAMIWTALGLYSMSSLRQERTRRSAAMVSATSGAVVTKSSSDGSANP